MKSIVDALVLMCLLLTQAFAFCQQFQIDGVLTDLPDQSIVRLYDAESQVVIDTAVVYNQGFQLKGTLLESPRSVVLHVQSSNINGMGYLFLGNEKISITGNGIIFPKNLKVTGSRYHRVKEKLDKLLLSTEEKKQNYNEQLKKLYQSGQLTDSIKEIYLGNNGKMQQLELEKRSIEKDFIIENSATEYGLYLLNIYKNSLFTDPELKVAYKKLPKKMRESKTAQAISTYLKYPKLVRGDFYRDFTAIDAAGKIVVLNDLFDKQYVLIDFSTPTCGNSMNSRSMLQQLQKEHRDKVTLITYYTESNKDHFDFFSNPENYPWKHLWNTDGGYNETILKYRVGGTPTYFLFDKKGKLIESWMGFQEDTFAKILKLIG